MSRPDPLEGTPYRALRVVGQGGSSLVYLAGARAHSEIVVVKVLRTELAVVREVRVRFRQEARAMMSLRHPNIVRVHACDELLDGRPYYVMERLEGVTLHEHLARRGSLGVVEALELMVPLLRALQAAHDAGVIHRDIKAANVFLHSPPSGPTVPKLLDFGVAKILHPQSSDAPSSAPDTGVGLAVGTPVYMSPEQVRCEPLDARSDVYQAGDLLYRMLTGRGPFDRHRTAGRITEARLSERPPRPSAVMAAALPRPLEDVILRSLELEPAKRFQSAGALAEALTRWMESPSARAGREWRRTASNCARSRCWVVLALVVFALGAAVGCWWL